MQIIHSSALALCSAIAFGASYLAVKRERVDPSSVNADGQTGVQPGGAGNIPNSQPLNPIEVRPYSQASDIEDYAGVGQPNTNPNYQPGNQSAATMFQSALLRQQGKIA